jgi:hypothetical protein
MRADMFAQPLTDALKPTIKPPDTSAGDVAAPLGGTGEELATGAGVDGAGEGVDPGSRSGDWAGGEDGVRPRLVWRRAA